MGDVAAPKFAILDANAAIGTAKAGVLLLVGRLFTSVLVPPSVVHEVTDPVSHAAIEAALSDWLAQDAPTPESMARVSRPADPADREVLALALDHRPCVILSGDRGLINQARLLGIHTISAPRIVQLLAKARLVPAARPHLDLMREQGFGIPEGLYEEILASLGE